MIEHQDDSCLRAIVEQLILPIFPNKHYWSDTYYWDTGKDKDMVLTVYGDIESSTQSSPRLAQFTFSREGMAEALKACGYTNPEEWG